MSVDEREELLALVYVASLAPKDVTEDDAADMVEALQRGTNHSGVQPVHTAGGDAR